MVPATVAGYVPWFIVARNPLPSPVSQVTSVVFFTIGGMIYLWCVWDFAAFGRGTPAPIDAPKRLVVRGLYRYTRNPMYVGILTVLLGWGVRSPTWGLLLYGFCVGSAFHLFVVLYEEPHLRKVFGTDYEHYCSRVKRWFKV